MFILFSDLRSTKQGKGEGRQNSSISNAMSVEVCCRFQSVAYAKLSKSNKCVLVNTKWDMSEES